ncbi:HDIG domain-containing protein [Pseudenhygromyxa sp. WMMC2535]|uniref:HDIG domain-containing metalloprotein n=1 Tax=Pseudenhygromyxa sp. WMMC2535 TaxID=2712867 RepID=UPI001554C23E|nr:HDIG domain-containing metalloprotein [Pseudenhygromyxa sp. WMMC2535]NVB41418.1 HDIG domain-containing protein [Pseudenhygromyxa sp. WMMC2535]
MQVQPDVADVSGVIRYARPRASLHLRAALVLAWAVALVVFVDLPLWLVGSGRGLGSDSLASFNHHMVFADGWVFIPRGHVLGDFERVGALRRFYAEMHGEWIPRTIGLGILGLLSGLGLQRLLERLGGRFCWRREQLAIFAWLVGALLLIRLNLMFLPIAATWTPVAAVLVPVALQLDRRAVLGCGAAVALATALMIPPVDPVLGATFAVQAAALAVVIPRRRGAGWRWALRLASSCAIVTTLGYVAAQLLVFGALDPLDLASAEWGRLVGALVAGLLWPLVGLALDPLFERAVGNLSRSTLLELADLNNPILQRISTRAPGTWAHSRAMANLAESAAHAVGADALLVRVGAYYHDLGKADEPQFFIENLARGVVSPHEGLAPKVSAAKIIHHVRSSVVRGRATGLPEPIIDFMHTHHGSGRVEFFYQKALAGDPEGVDEADFSYPGTKPQSPETGILMIVDSVEAASRTLKAPDQRQLESMLRQIGFSKLMTAQLDDCGLSMADMRRIIETLIDAILASSHERISYPWQEEEAREQEAQAKRQVPRTATIADGGSGAAPVEYEPSGTLPLGAAPLRVIAARDDEPSASPLDGAAAGDDAPGS